MKRKVFILLVHSLFSRFAFSASTRVAFLEVKKWSGEKLILEPGFNYAHLAIEFDGGWLHANPKRGVEVVQESELQQIGEIREILETDAVGVSLKKARALIGKPYDSFFSWTDERIYCSELVGKLLGMPPTPMHFDPVLWPSFFHQYEGQPGMSPSKIYFYLLEELQAESRRQNPIFSAASF